MKLLESKEFKKACLYGYTKSQGGMNMPELMKIARGVGVDPSLTRKKMLELICAKEKDKTKKAGGVVKRAKDDAITRQKKRIEKRVAMGKKLLKKYSLFKTIQLMKKEK